MGTSFHYVVNYTNINMQCDCLGYFREPQHPHPFYVYVNFPIAISKESNV